MRILLGLKNLYYLGEGLLVLLGKALCEPLTLKHHQLLVDAGFELHLGVVVPGFEDVVIGSDVEAVAALMRELQLSLPLIKPRSPRG